MSKTPPRGFETAEYQRRTRRAQELMAARNMAGMLLTTEAEIRYFSGFQTLFWQSPARPWFLFLPADGAPIAVIPEIGAALMGKTWITDIRTWAAPAPADEGISLLQELLAPIASRRGVLGLLKGPETALRMPLADYERLRQVLPGLKTADATPIVRQLRMVKSEAEIAKLRHICAIGNRSFARLPEIAQEGQPLEDLFRAFRREALAQGADDVPYLVGGADQGGYHDVISPPSTRALQHGDILMLDTGATWDGYFCDFDRNFAISQADNASKHAYALLWQATEAALETIRPGMTCAAVYDVMRAMIHKQAPSGGNVGRFGHGLGMQLTEWPSFASFDDTVLEENMVITLEPSLSYGEGRIMVHEENLVLRADGPELLTTRAAPELPVI